MEIIMERAELELFSVIEAIHRDPASWKDWRCLHLEMPRLAGHTQCMQVQTNMVHALQSILKPFSGNAYFCGCSEIYVFCKGVSDALLGQAGDMLSTVMLEMTGAPATYKVWDLTSDALQLLQLEISFPASETTEEKEIVKNGVLPDLSDRHGKESASLHLARQPKVLLVEDDPVTRWLVRSALKETCTLITAQNAGSAVDSFNKCRPDLVFLDLNLPDKSGSDVLRHILRQDPQAKVVIFTGQDHMDNIIKMLEEGAAGFVAKPFTKDRLMHYINTVSL